MASPLAPPAAAPKNDFLSSLPAANLTAASSSSSSSSAFAPVTNVFRRLQSLRESLDLPNPGTVENLQKEVKTTLLSNFFFDGARADLTKVLSMNPQFHVTHSFALGSQTAPPSYNFGAAFATEKLMMHGGIDNDANLNGRLNYSWSPSSISKAQCSLTSQPGQSLIQAEHDFIGRDFALNLRAANPSLADGTGIYTGSILQSITKNIALGAEVLVQNSQMGADLGFQYYGKYTGSNRDWIGTMILQPQGMLQATYWQKLSEKLDVAADIQIVNVPQRRDAIATLGAKWDLRMSQFRAQLDSTGKVSALLEQRFAPSFAFLFSGEIDHLKNSAKVGVGVMIESSTMTPEEMGMAMPPGYPMPPQ